MLAVCLAETKKPTAGKMNKKIKYSLIAFALSALFFIVLGIPTALVPIGIYTRMLPASAADYVLLGLTSALAGAYVSYSLYLRSASDSKSGYSALAGTAAGVLSFGCPICNMLLVSAFGTAALLAFFEPYRHYLGLLAVVLFASAFWLKIRKCKKC